MRFPLARGHLQSDYSVNSVDFSVDFSVFDLQRRWLKDVEGDWKFLSEKDSRSSLRVTAVFWTH